MKKFYSLFNQAIQLSEVHNGPASTWGYEMGYSIGDDGLPVDDYVNKAVDNFNKYLAPYLRGTLDLSRVTTGKVIRYYLADGSSFFFSATNVTYINFYPGNMDKCLKFAQKDGVCRFAFNFHPKTGEKTTLEPYTDTTGPSDKFYNWNGTDSLYTACEKSGLYCTKLLEQNNWKIPKDYPFKVRY